jgi:KaiC/GvpD/RAD55 family RecA-like ATPase
MHSTDTITDYGFSAISDNIILLRYVMAAGEFRPSLAIVKTRGSAHSFATSFYSIGTGGLRLDGRASSIADGAQASTPRKPDKPRDGRGRR